MVWLPEAFDVTLCSVVGLLKLPLASDSCAVKVQLPAGKFDAVLYVNGTDTPVTP
jgi:hypothetical protein